MFRFYHLNCLNTSRRSVFIIIPFTDRKSQKGLWVNHSTLIKPYCLYHCHFQVLVTPNVRRDILLHEKSTYFLPLVGLIWCNFKLYNLNWIYMYSLPNRKTLDSTSLCSHYLGQYSIIKNWECKTIFSHSYPMDFMPSDTYMM